LKRKSYKTKRLLFAFNILFLVILSVSVSIMPYNSKTDGVTDMKILTGIMFWLGLIGTVFFASLINYFRSKDKLFNKAAEKYNKLGLTHFFQNLPAKIFDSLLIIALIGFILSFVFNFTLSVKFIFISAIIFSFGMHCMLNGINFVYVMNKRIRRVKRHE